MKRVSEDHILLGIILLVGAAIRLWGIDFGLPYLYHPDEPRRVAIAQDMFKTGDLNPHFLRYPSLFIYINALAYVPYYQFGKLFGLFGSPADVLPPVVLTTGLGQAPLPSAVLMGRLISVLFGVATIGLVFLIGKRLYDKPWVGLLAALMVAVSPTNVTDSRYITPDTSLAFFVLVVAWASLRILQQGKAIDYVVAGCATGLAASSKYPGALAMVVPLAAHFLHPGTKGIKDYGLFLVLVLAPVAFLATSPFALLDHDRLLSDTSSVFEHYSSGHAGMEGNSLSWYLEYSWQTAGVIYIVAALGILRGLYSRTREIILLSVFPLVYFAFISSFEVRNARTLLPLTPFMFLLAAWYLAHLLNRANEMRPEVLRRASILAIVCILAIGLIMPTTATIKDTIRLTTVDGRETARLWINENLPPGARLALESYSPFVDPGRFSVDAVPRIIEHEPEWYIEQGFDYLVFSQGMYGRFYAEPERYSAQISQYDGFFNRFNPTRVFTDGDLEVRVYATR